MPIETRSLERSFSYNGLRLPDPDTEAHTRTGPRFIREHLSRDHNSSGRGAGCEWQHTSLQIHSRHWNEGMTEQDRQLEAALRELDEFARDPHRDCLLNKFICQESQYFSSRNFSARLSASDRTTRREEFAAPCLPRLPAWYTRADCARTRLCHSATPARAIRVLSKGLFIPCRAIHSEPAPGRSRPAGQLVRVAEHPYVPPTHR